MKLTTSIQHITNMDSNTFVCSAKSDKVIYYKYQQKEPFSLLIMADYQHNELVLEFTGKILQDKYPQLLNRDTILYALENINKLNVCTLNTEAILSDAEVVKCDVTTDVTHDINSIIPTIRQNLANYSKWNIKRYANGIVLENTVSTPRYKKRLVIYDKEKEMQMTDNVNFVNRLPDGQAVTDYFRSKVRFELNINTKQQIRQLLNIPNNDLQSVLNATANPLLAVIDEAVRYEPQRPKAKTLRDYERELLLRSCDFDLVKVEATIRGLSSKNTPIKRAMQPYRELAKRIQTDTTPQTDLRALVS